MKLTHVLLFEICFPAFVCAKPSVIPDICLLVAEPSHKLDNGAVFFDPVCGRRRSTISGGAASTSVPAPEEKDGRIGTADTRATAMLT